MATHAVILAWKIPWKEKPGRIQSMGVAKSQTLLSDWAHLTKSERNLAVRTIKIIIQKQLFPWSLTVITEPPDIGGKTAASTPLAEKIRVSFTHAVPPFLAWENRELSTAWGQVPVVSRLKLSALTQAEEQYIADILAVSQSMRAVMPLMLRDDSPAAFQGTETGQWRGEWGQSMVKPSSMISPPSSFLL